MVDKEMLSAISELLDEKLEQKFDEKLQPVYDRLDGLETDVKGLQVDVGSVKSQLENKVISRLSTIESCYLDTFNRYVERTDQIDSMAVDIEVLKSTVSEHSRRLEKIPG